MNARYISIVSVALLGLTLNIEVGVASELSVGSERRPVAKVPAVKTHVAVVSDEYSSDAVPRAEARSSPFGSRPVAVRGGQRDPSCTRWGAWSNVERLYITLLDSGSDFLGYVGPLCRAVQANSACRGEVNEPVPLRTWCNDVWPPDTAYASALRGRVDVVAISGLRSVDLVEEEEEGEDVKLFFVSGSREFHIVVRETQLSAATSDGLVDIASSSVRRQFNARESVRRVEYAWLERRGSFSRTLVELGRLVWDGSKPGSGKFLLMRDGTPMGALQIECRIVCENEAGCPCTPSVIVRPEASDTGD